MIKDFLQDLIYLLLVFYDETLRKAEILVDFLAAPIVYSSLMGVALAEGDIKSGSQIAVLLYLAFMLREIVSFLADLHQAVNTNSRNQVKTFALLTRLLSAINNIPARTRGKKND